MRQITVIIIQGAVRCLWWRDGVGDLGVLVERVGGIGCALWVHDRCHTAEGIPAGKHGIPQAKLVIAVVILGDGGGIKCVLHLCP